MIENEHVQSELFFGLSAYTNLSNFINMETTLQHFNQYSTESAMNWPGLTSNRFPKMRYMHPRKDVIQSGTPLYIQVSIFPTMFLFQEENIISQITLLSILLDRGSDNIKIWSIGVQNQQANVCVILVLLNLILDMKKATIKNQCLSIKINPLESGLFTILIWEMVKNNILWRIECKEKLKSINILSEKVPLRMKLYRWVRDFHRFDIDFTDSFHIFHQ